MYEGHFLRRTKNNIFKFLSAETAGRPLKLNELPLKTDLVVWVPLTNIQKTIYQFLIENQDLQKIVEEREVKNAFFMLSYIKKVCLHPQLLAATSIEKKKNLGLLSREEQAALQAQIDEEEQNAETWTMRTRRTNKHENKKTKRMCEALEYAERNQKPEIEGELKDVPVLSNDDDWQQKKKLSKKSDASIQKKKGEGKCLFETFNLREILAEIEKAETEKDVKSNIGFSTKLQVLMTLMTNLRSEGHRLLIFSMSKKVLSIIEDILNSGYLGKDPQGRDLKYIRIDGNTEIAAREQMCIDFNEDPSVFCALLTTKVGGFGLNLTGADRAIILDPDWNPANDNQAVDRVFRIGQKRDVIVYRLVTMGTIEEKIYRRQIYKKSMTLATVDSNQNQQADFEKYFKNDDLFELFEFDPKTCNEACETLDLLLKREGCPYEETPTNVKHMKFLKDQPNVKGITLNSHLLKGFGKDANSDTELSERESFDSLPQRSRKNGHSEKICAKSAMTKASKYSESQESSNMVQQRKGRNFTDDDFDLELSKMSSQRKSRLVKT